MRVGDRSTNLILGIVTLILSALVGLVIPLASGGGGSTDTLAWTPPPATATHAATALLPRPRTPDFGPFPRAFFTAVATQGDRAVVVWYDRRPGAEGVYARSLRVLVDR